MKVWKSYSFEESVYSAHEQLSRRKDEGEGRDRIEYFVLILAFRKVIYRVHASYEQEKRKDVKDGGKGGE